MPADSTTGTRSLWVATCEIAPPPPLDADASADVCIIGAGIAGLTTAYRLACAGRSVIVLDDGLVGGGQTGRTTAHLSNALDDRYCVLEKLHGETGSRLAAESHTKAIDEIESIVNRERIDCGLERLDGFLFVPPGEDPEILERELAAAHRAGLADVRRVDDASFGGFDLGPSLVFPRQAQFHPLAYLRGLADAIVARGGCLRTARARSIEGGDQTRVETGLGHVVSADAVVVATNTPINDRVAIHTKQAAYRTYVIGVPVPCGTVAPALCWDTGDPYHYLRIQRGSPCDVLIVGGEDHKTGQPGDDERARFARLEAWTAARFPEAGPAEFAWSGQVMEPADGLAFIGRNPGDDPNVFVVTGDSGNGMTHGTIAGMLIGDLILGGDNPWAALYDPARKPLRAVKDYLAENLNVAARYADHLRGGELDSVSELPPGTGAIVRRGVRKVAAYRDRNGFLHELSATCPHLGCVVSWNAAESTWDCPCHGSRFSLDGSVLNGPANRGLAPASVQE